MENKDLSKARMILFAMTAIGLLFMVACALSLTGCTISMQNIHTEGYAEDLVDETQTNTPNVSPDISIPLTGVLPNLPKVPHLDIAKKEDKK